MQTKASAYLLQVLICNTRLIPPICPVKYIDGQRVSYTLLALSYTCGNINQKFIERLKKETGICIIMVWLKACIYRVSEVV